SLRWFSWYAQRGFLEHSDGYGSDGAYPKTVAAPALRLTAGCAVALAPVPHQSLSDLAPVLRAHHGHCGTRVQPAARVYRAVVVWPFGLFWRGGIRRGLYGEVSAHPLDGAVCARWSAADSP